MIITRAVFHHDNINDYDIVVDDNDNYDDVITLMRYFPCYWKSLGITRESPDMVYLASFIWCFMTH